MEKTAIFTPITASTPPGAVRQKPVADFRMAVGTSAILFPRDTMLASTGFEILADRRRVVGNQAQWAIAGILIVVADMIFANINHRRSTVYSFVN